MNPLLEAFGVGLEDVHSQTLEGATRCHLGRNKERRAGRVGLAGLLGPCREGALAIPQKIATGRMLHLKRSRERSEGIPRNRVVLGGGEVFVSGRFARRWLEGRQCWEAIGNYEIIPTATATASAIILGRRFTAVRSGLLLVVGHDRSPGDSVALRGTSTLCAPSAYLHLSAAPAFLPWPRVRKTGIYGTYISGSVGDDEKLWLQDEKLWLPVQASWGEGGIGDYWSCCVVFHHINKPPRGKGRNLSAVHFTFSFYYRTFYFSHILLGCCFFSSNRSKAKSKHKHRSKSCYNVYMPSYVHQSQTQGIYTYITRCVTKRKTPTK